MTNNTSKIRNIAIIAHIDHGKTSILDCMLKYAQIFRENEAIPERIMDSYDQEKERGITIFSKHTSLRYKNYKINIIDTPGHADFSGEVERVLGMVDSVLLLVDAQEGPMPQTRFVLKKALEHKLKPILVINKIDREHADPDRVLNEVFDLFVELDANDEQLDFTYCYASALAGYAMRHIDDERKDIDPLFDLIIEKVPLPSGDPKAPFLMQCVTISYDKYLGRQATGQILQGKVRRNDDIIHIDRNGNEKRAKVNRIQGYLGIQKVEQDEAFCGDIVSIAGIPDIIIGDTLCSPQKIVHLPPIELEEPTLSIDVMVNNSPLAGKDGKNLTMNKIRDRLQLEKRSNISLVIEDKGEFITVSGRGELHLAVMLEALRREDYELSISKPKVILKTIDSVVCEPIERVYIEVPEEYSGTVIEELSKRKGEMQKLSTNEHGIFHMDFLIPTRGLMGWRSEFLTKTRGQGILTSVFDAFSPMKGEISNRNRGVLVSIANGNSTPYAIFNLQSRGFFFISSNEEVYEGMIVGEHSRTNDLGVNIVKGKQLTNVRSTGTDEMIQLTPPGRLTLEQAIDYIEDDELVEITPNHIRLRKRHLKESDRKRNR